MSDLKLTEDLMLNLQRVLASFEWDEDDYALVHAFTDGPRYPLLEALLERALASLAPTPTAPRPEACPRCKGTGKLTVSVEMREGKFNEKPCRICGGSGKAGLDSGLEVK